MVSRFEGALSSLASLEQRYEALAGSEARSAERARGAEAALEAERAEAAALRERVSRLEAEARRAEDARALAEAEAERCRAAGASSQALLEAVRHLDERGVRVQDIGIRRPTLDDAFLNLTGATS